MEKIYAILFKGDEVIGDNFLIGLNKQLRDDGLFLIYQTTVRPPKKLKIVEAENGGVRQ